MYQAGLKGNFDVLGAHGAGYKAPPEIAKLLPGYFRSKQEVSQSGGMRWLCADASLKAFELAAGLGVDLLAAAGAAGAMVSTTSSSRGRKRVSCWASMDSPMWRLWARGVSKGNGYPALACWTGY